MATGNEILAYGGNAALGLGNDVGAIGEIDTKVLTDSVMNAAYQSMSRNKTIYEQKIKDRDEGLKLLATGQLQLDQVLPQDREALQKKIGKVKNLFIEHNGDLKSDPKVWLEASSLLAEFNEDNVLAKSKFLEINKLKAQRAKTKRPDLIKKLDEHIKIQEEQPYTKMVEPFQETLDYNPTRIFLLGQATPNEAVSDVADVKYDAQGNLIETTGGTPNTKKASTAKGQIPVPIANKFYNITKTKSQDGFTEYNRGVLDFDKMKTQAYIDYGRNDALGSYYEVNKGITDMVTDPVNGNNLIKSGNDAIDRYNAVSGKPPLSHIELKMDGDKPVLDENGYIQSANGDRLPDIQAKLSLIGAPLTVATESLDENALYTAEIKSKIGANDALAANRYSGVGVNLAKNKYWNAKASDLENEQTIPNTFDYIIGKAKPLDLHITNKEVNKRTGKTTITGQQDKTELFVYDEDIAAGDKSVVMGTEINPKGKVVTVPIKPLKLPDGKMGYKVVEGDGGTAPNGKFYNSQDLQTMYEANKQQQKTNISFNEYINELVKKGFKRNTGLKGANGTGTSESTMRGIKLQLKLANQNPSDQKIEDANQEDPL